MNILCWLVLACAAAAAFSGVCAYILSAVIANAYNRKQHKNSRQYRNTGGDVKERETFFNGKPHPNYNTSRRICQYEITVWHIFRHED